MDSTVKLSSKEVPYLTAENVGLHSKLVFYDKNHAQIYMNLTILQALNCNFLHYLDYEESEIAVSTEFEMHELQELQRFYYTGSCNLEIVSCVLDALGIDLTQFCLQSQIRVKKDHVKVEVKSEPKDPNDVKDVLMELPHPDEYLEYSEESEYSEYSDSEEESYSRPKKFKSSKSPRIKGQGRADHYRPRDYNKNQDFLKYELPKVMIMIYRFFRNGPSF